MERLSNFTHQYIMESNQAHQMIQKYVDTIKLGRRRRRWSDEPHLNSLQMGYSNFLHGYNSNKNAQTRNGYNYNSHKEPQLPLVLVPQNNEAECVSSNQMSSFGFIGFVLNMINAVINVSNNMNNRLNSNNNNDNNNNNNDQNANQVMQTNTVDNDNDVMTTIGRRMKRLQEMHRQGKQNEKRITQYMKRKKRSTTHICSFHNLEHCLILRSTTEKQLVDESIIVGLILVEMWREIVFAQNISSATQTLCEVTKSLSGVSLLSKTMAEKSGLFIAEILGFDQIERDQLLLASSRGLQGRPCRFDTI